METFKFNRNYTLAICLVLVVFINSACQKTASEQPNSTQVGLTSPSLNTQVWYEIFFTEPESPQSQTKRGGPDRKLADAIERSRVSVDVAVLQLDLWSIRDAMISAHRRGVSVRMVTDSDYMDEAEVQDLIRAGIPVVSDRREGLMHHKFVVIDRGEIWTGSMNFTINGAYYNNNHLIRIQSTKLAENYTVEFEEMFIHDHFGPGSLSNTPNPSFTFNDTYIENYFSPEDNTESHILKLLRAAKESIYFMAYSFTSDAMADAILERASQGVEIAGLFETSQYYSNAGTDFDRFLNAGLDMRLDDNPKNMHHKVIVIDESVVIAGSYNYSFFAETRNDENTLVLHNPDIARLFILEFEKLYEKGIQPQVE